ncbi:MAG TPA: hypothetical protein VHW00_22675 [Thermoanaerobaculia bacterium]|nr:hypothetical protein [Thermoanaerobaculia bacterium]
MSSKYSQERNEGSSASRREFIRTASVATVGLVAAGAMGAPLTEVPVRLVDDWRGQQIRQYFLTIVGENTRLGYDLAKYFERASIRRTRSSLPNAPSVFHASYASDVIVLAPERFDQVRSGAYIRAANWVYYDHVAPRPFKDVTIDEMRCSLHPAIVDRFDAVPFPCGERTRFDPSWEAQYQATLEYYRKYHDTNDIDFSQCELEYVRPANTMARVGAKKPSIMTFTIADKTTTPIRRAQLFGPDAA